MNEIFLVFLSLSLSGSLIAAILFLIRPLINRHLSNSWHYYIYLLVILRLLIPVGSDTSIIGRLFIQLQQDSFDEKALSYINIDSDMLNLEAPDVQTQSSLITPNDLIQNTKPDMACIIIDWLWIAWFLPAFILLVIKIVGYVYFVKSVKKNNHHIKSPAMLRHYQKICERMKISRTPGLFENKQVLSPILIGFIHPAVVLPETDVSDTEFQYILQHELTHYQRKDIIYKWLVQIVVCLHWYNPLIYRISKRINWNCELACDEAVIKSLDKKQKTAYGDMLLDSIKTYKTMRHPAITVTLSEDSKMIKERLYAIKRYRHKTRRSAALALILSLSMLIVTACTGAYTAPKTTSAPEENVSPSSANEKPNSTALDKTIEPIPATVEEMKLTYYEDDEPDGRWPYLHWIVSNQSNQTITNYEMACLAYDKDGKPVELTWSRLPLTDGYTITEYSDQSDKAYEHLITMSYEPIEPGRNQDLQGGWSLFDGWNQAEGTHVVEYVVSCLKTLTFEDGSVWENPEYVEWADKFKGKNADIAELQSYHTGV